MEIRKAVDSQGQELKQVTYVVMEPCDSDEEFDLHGDMTTEDEVRKACENFNKHCRKANLLHLFETDSFEIIESYISPVEFEINKEIVKKGSWLATIQVVEDWLWDDIKSGEFTGLSIQANARTEELEGE